MKDEKRASFSYLQEPKRTPMNIGIQTWGSDGDIHPFIALAGGLAAAGHQVTLAVTSAEHKSYEHFAERLGFRLVQVGYIGKDDDELIHLATAMHQAADPLKQLDVIIEGMFEPGVPAMYDAARTLCSENDLLIGHFLVHPLAAAAEKAAKPYLTVTLNQSAIPTDFAPPVGVPYLGRLLNHLLWKIGIKILNSHILPPINRLRNQEGLTPATSFRQIWESPLANLIAVSPAFCPPRPDWTANQRVCGFFNLPDEARPWDMPDDLKRFLEKGPPPIYITFGSMLAVLKDKTELTQTTRLLIDSVRLAGCRAIIQSRWPDVHTIAEDNAIYRITAAPHPKIFPFCSAIVHHGGAGTTQTATLCGCPSIVVAHIVDQYFWGQELTKLGIAPKLLDRRKVTPKKLGRAIRLVLDSPDMAERARKLSEQLRAENGVKVAVAVIENLT